MMNYNNSIIVIKNYTFNKRIWFGLFVFIMTFSRGQTVIHQESFENAPNGASVDYSADTEFGAGDTNDYWQRIDITGNGKDEIDTGITGGDGVKMYAGEDIDGATPTPKVLTIVNTDVTGYTDIKVQIAAGSGEQNKYDAGDYIEVYVKKDGGSETLVGAFYGYDHQNGDSTNGRMYQDVNLNGSTSDDGSSAQLSKTMQDFTFDVSGGFSYLQVVIKMTTNSGDEVLMVDNVRIIGTPAGNGPTITNITQTPVTVTSSDTVSVSADVTDTDGVSGVELHWGTASGSLSHTINMSLSSGDTYTTDTDIPAQADGTTVYYEVYAIDNNSDDTTSAEQSYNVDDTPPCATELIISEYIEGSSNNKYLEIYNGTGAVINMDDYDIRIYSNGSNSVSTTINLDNVNLADGDVFVIANSSANIWSNTPDQTSGNLNFNGDDAVELYNTATGQSVDIIGQIGNDPGSQWGSGSTTTKDHTLVRKANVTSGDTNGSDTFDPAVEWDGFNQDDVSYLGSHTMTCGSCSEPTADAIFHANSPQNITTTGVTLNWTNGDGENRIVVLRESNPVSFVPADGNTYTGNSDFSTATDVSGNGEKVVYNGNGSTIDITGLTPGTLYYAVIYEYSCAPGSEDYFISGSPATDSFYTEPEKPDNFTADCVGATSIDLSWTAPANGNFDGYLLVTREGATPHSVNSLDPNTNLGDDTDYTAAATYGSSSPYSRILYKGTGTSAIITGLTNGTSYTFQVFAYSANGTLYKYSDAKQLTKTITLEDVTSPLTSVANQEVTVSWINPGSSCYDEILVVANETAGIDFSPSGDGSAYTANSNYAGNNSVVYKGTGEQVTVTGLTNGTTYYFEIFVRKGTDWSDGVEVSDVPQDITIMDAGDLAILAVNTDIDNKPGSTGNGSGDQIAFVCFKDIKPGTKLYFTDNGYEREVAGKWGNTEGVIAITRQNTTLTKGTIIVIETNDQTNGNITYANHFDVYTCGAIDSDWTKEYIAGQGGFNLNNDDDVWIMQGGVWDNGTAGDHDATYTGNVLYGWTESGWDNGIGNGANGTKWSNLFPYSKCFTTVAPAGDGKVKFNDPVDPDFSITTNDKLDWIALINNTANWDTYSTTSDYNTNGYDYKGNTTCPAMTIATSTHSAGLWKGNDTNWFDCSNWDNLKVPDETVDVTISNSATNPAVIDASAAGADLYDYKAITKNLTIEDGNWVEVNTSSDTLEVHGDLTIENNAILDMNDGDTTTLDGNLLIWGNWINNYGDDGFDQGNSTVTFKGSAPQTVNAGSVTEKFYNLEIDNAAGVNFDSGNIHAEHDLNILHDTAIDITDGHYLLAGHDLVNNANITIENQGSLVQTDDSGSISGNGTFKLNKTSLPLNHYYDYVYWSSPLNSSTFTLGDIVSNAWRYYKFDPNEANNGHTYPGWVMLSASDNPQAGVGYAVSAPNGASANTILNVTFTKGSDPFNNGEISVPILKKGGPDNVGDYNLVGNPYPSAIDFHALYNDNSAAINGVYYLWTNCAGLDANGHHQDSGYTTYTYSGGIGTATAACNGTANQGGTASQYIATGQGFIVEAAADNQTLTFKNAHRVTGNNDNFLNRSTINRDIVWLNLTNDTGKFSQIAVGFYPGATAGYDAMFDAHSLNAGGGFSLYSLVGSDKLVIQGLAPDNIEQTIVPLGVEVSSPGNITLNIDHLERFNDYDIYLTDNNTRILHNLKLSPYTVYLDNGVYENRFALTFARSLDVTGQTTTVPLNLSQHNGIFKLWRTDDKNLQTVKVYNISGQLIYEKETINRPDIEIDLRNIATGNLLLFKVTDDKGKTVVKKAVIR